MHVSEDVAQGAVDAKHSQLMEKMSAHVLALSGVAWEIVSLDPRMTGVTNGYRILPKRGISALNDHAAELWEDRGQELFVLRVWIRKTVR